LLKLLKDLNIDENTLVLLSSDNGPHQEGGHDPVFFDSNGPFRGFKRDLYEGGIRTALLARWPGKIEAGSKSALISAHWDVLPTFCELAGVAPPLGIDGISFVPTLLGEPVKQQPHPYLYWEFHERGGKRAVRFGPWKAVQLNLQKDADGPIEIYYLLDDSGETKNIAGDHPEIVALAKQSFAESHAPSAIWPIRSLGEGESPAK
jgi:arylsulfatase A-like enzyme